ncbi:MAG: hypothetical protein ACRD1R_17350 [Acidobacteriota bacterium]
MAHEQGPAKAYLDKAGLGPLLQGEAPNQPDWPAALKALSDLDVRYVVVPEARTEIQSELARLGLPCFYRDSDVLVYTTDAAE